MTQCSRCKIENGEAKCFCQAGYKLAEDNISCIGK